MRHFFIFLLIWKCEKVKRFWVWLCFCSSGTSQGKQKFIPWNDELFETTVQIYQTSFAFRNRYYSTSCHVFFSLCLVSDTCQYPTLIRSLKHVDLWLHSATFVVFFQLLSVFMCQCLCLDRCFLPMKHKHWHVDIKRIFNLKCRCYTNLWLNTNTDIENLTPYTILTCQHH
jgi:hypothetical protein